MVKAGLTSPEPVSDGGVVAFNDRGLPAGCEEEKNDAWLGEKSNL